MNPIHSRTVSRRTVLRSAGAAAAIAAVGRRVFPLAGQLAPRGAAIRTPIAKTRYGLVSGTLEDGINVFRSIPYGADTAPVRFQAPLPPTPWTGVKACDTFTTRAPQLTALRGPQAANSAPSLGSAACRAAGRLRASRPRPACRAKIACISTSSRPACATIASARCWSISTAAPTTTARSTAPLYDGKRLCHRGDVVVVTVNHRLNAFGFLYLAGIDPKAVSRLRQRGHA